MDTGTWIGVALAILTLVWSVVALLLQRIDKQQAKELKDLNDKTQLLFTKHDEDAKRLVDLELEIARKHYVKTELDAKFDKLESSIRTGLNELGTKFDALTAELLRHFSSNGTKGQ